MSSSTKRDLKKYLIANFMGVQINVPVEDITNVVSLEKDVGEAPRSVVVEGSLEKQMSIEPVIEQPPISPYGEPIQLHEKDVPETETEPIYRYLYDNPLSTEFSFDRDYNKLYKISLCLYKINDDLKTPFLEFFFMKKDNVFHFPQTDLNMEPFADINTMGQQISPMESMESNKDDEDDEDDDIDSEFMNQCSLFLMNNMKMEEIDEKRIKTMYRGFIEEPGELYNTIFAVFDCTDINVTMNSNEYAWGIVDEIMVTCKIANTPVENAVTQLLKENPLLVYIKTRDGSNCPIPISLYLCTQIGKNAYYNENENPLTTMSLINPRVNHEIFDEVYMFSREPFNIENMNRIKRFALFTRDTLYFFNKDASITDILNEPDNAGNESDIIYDEYSNFSFYENGNNIWCVKELESFVEI
jgi:hypothetical protein